MCDERVSKEYRWAAPLVWTCHVPKSLSALLFDLPSEAAENMEYPTCGAVMVQLGFVLRNWVRVSDPLGHRSVRCICGGTGGRLRTHPRLGKGVFCGNWGLS